MKLNSEMLDVMRKATKLLQQGRKGDATSTIQRVLQQVLPGAMRGPGSTPSSASTTPQPPQPTMKDINPPPPGRPRAAATADPATDPAGNSAADPAAAASAANSATGNAGGIPAFVSDLLDRLGVGGVGGVASGTAAQAPSTPTARGRTQAESRDAGTFLSGSVTNAAGSRRYKLYVPASYDRQSQQRTQRVPLVVMLHGCTQSPDDFAAGTQMNSYAEGTPCLVLYPEQSSSANSSRCWNWFSAIDQQRGQGEPSIIADMTREIIAAYDVDPARVYVAGLSAGGAMAAIMGSTYPELYAAVGIHSGLPYAAATDLPSALQAMRSGMNEAKSARTQPQPDTRPIIVFHGDRDTTVHPRNGEQLIAQNVPRNAVTSVVSGGAPGGLTYTRTIHQSGAGLPLAEQWLIHGAGHAWSGGSSAGSYTEQRGPQATQEMMRFFATRPIQ